jgi:hypothetical protein
MYRVVLRRFKPHTSAIDKEYTIATESTYDRADKTAKHYSKLYQAKGLYSLKDYYPSHIVTVIAD